MECETDNVRNWREWWSSETFRLSVVALEGGGREGVFGYTWVGIVLLAREVSPSSCKIV